MISFLGMLSNLPDEGGTEAFNGGGNSNSNELSQISDELESFDAYCEYERSRHHGRGRGLRAKSLLFFEMK